MRACIECDGSAFDGALPPFHSTRNALPPAGITISRSLQNTHLPMERARNLTCDGYSPVLRSNHRGTSGDPCFCNRTPGATGRSVRAAKAPSVSADAVNSRILLDIDLRQGGLRRDRNNTEVSTHRTK